MKIDDTQIEFDDPSREWKLVNAWFIKQLDFWVRFSIREIVLPDQSSLAPV